MSFFALAEKAARKQGCEEKIKIILAPNYGAGIAKESGMYCISLGVMLLSILSEDELYQILLHEFAHVTKENNKGMRERRYGSWLENGNKHFLSKLTAKMYAFVDVEDYQKVSVSDATLGIEKAYEEFMGSNEETDMK